MTLLWELLRWWGLATVLCSGLLVLLVVVQFALGGLRRRYARRRRSRRAAVPRAVPGPVSR